MGLFNRTASDDIKVSVVTPVYNVETYLPECLESLRRQRLRGIEFICVNDGSTDGSLAILQDYARRDPRFVVIDKPNSGYGATMNVGVSRARGEYIGIVESDDFASPDMFKRLYRFASKNDCDIVKCNFYEHDSSGDRLQEVFRGYPYKKVFDVHEDSDVMRVLPAIWAAVYRKDMLDRYGIRFNETPGASFQDTSFVQRCWMASRRVAILPEGYLHYRVDRTDSSVKSDKKIFEVCGEYEVTESFMREDPERVRTFGPLLQVLKLGTYRWNYNRISNDWHEAFAERWAQEMRAAQQEGLLEQRLFDEADWTLIQELMADPKAFAAAHESI